jgi:hypothetical protein
VARGTGRGSGLAWAVALVVLLGPLPARSADDPLLRVREALERGDPAAAAADAAAFIARSPGDPRLADAQRLLGLAYEGTGARRAAWEQYALFLKNYPSDPARDDVADRADRLLRRVQERVNAPPARWQAVASLDGPLVSPDDTVLVVTVQAPAETDRVAPRLTRAALDGARIWVRASLGAPTSAFDPFDEQAVTRLEEWFREMASVPIEGFVMDGALAFGERTHTVAGDRAFSALASVIPDTPEGRERLAWTWAGTRARASAAALRRFVAAASEANPRIGWVLRVSADAVFRPERAVREAGEDWGELRAAAPTAVWAVDVPEGFEARLATALGEIGPRPRLARWIEGGAILPVR